MVNSEEILFNKNIQPIESLDNLVGFFSVLYEIDQELKQKEKDDIY